MSSEPFARAAGESASVVYLEGTLRWRELRALADSLDRLPRVGGLHLDWSRVSHVDYRGLRVVAEQILNLREEGLEICSSGLDPYLLALARVSLTVEEFEGLIGDAGSGVVGLGADFAQILSTGLSEN